jgi:hypothetical protein
LLARSAAVAAVILTISAFAVIETTGIGHGGSDFPRGLTPTATRTPVKPKATPTPRTPPPPPIVDGPADGPGIMLAECRSTGVNSVRVFFLWNPSRSGSQWVDLSIFNNNFAPGTYIGLGPLGRDAWGFVWEGLSQGTTHFARVNTLSGTGWHTSRTLGFYTPVCDPSQATRPPAQDMLDLRFNIEQAIVSSRINTAVAITDLQTGETVDVRGSETRLPGCTINLFALIRVAVDLQRGVYAEPQPGDLIGQTINRSDPITARTLMKYWIGNGDLGRGMIEVNDFMHALGMTDTLMDHPPAFPHESLFGFVDNRITARDANRGLQALWDGRALDPGWRDYMLQKMTLVKPGLNYLIPAGVGYGATASHKNGFLYAEGWADNDIGVVWFERGGQRFGYAISFFTQGVPSKYADIPLGQRISSLSWQWFVGRYGYP